MSTTLVNEPITRNKQTDQSGAGVKRKRKASPALNPPRRITPAKLKHAGRAKSRKFSRTASPVKHPTVTGSNREKSRLPVLPITEPQSKSPAAERYPLPLLQAQNSTVPCPLPDTISSASTSKILTQAEAIEHLARRASEGSQKCLDGLRKGLEGRPDIWRAAGDVNALAELSWIMAIGEGNKMLEESARLRLAEMKAGLVGDTSSPVERLLIDMIAVTWLANCQAEIAATKTGGSLQHAKLRLRRAESAQRRFFGALKMLSTIRTALAQTTLAKPKHSRTGASKQRRKG